MPIVKMTPERVAELQRLEQAVRTAREELQKYTEASFIEAPAKPGDIVEITGYSYRGSNMQVVRIELIGEGRGQFHWRATGFVLKKDGTPGLNHAETYWEIEPC